MEKSEQTGGAGAGRPATGVGCRLRVRGDGLLDGGHGGQTEGLADAGLEASSDGLERPGGGSLARKPQRGRPLEREERSDRRLTGRLPRPGACSPNARLERGTRGQVETQKEPTGCEDGLPAKVRRRRPAWPSMHQLAALAERASVRLPRGPGSVVASTRSRRTPKEGLLGWLGSVSVPRTGTRSDDAEGAPC